MAELINTKVFDAEKKFVDFAGLDYFWEKAKKYVDDVDAAASLRIDGVEGKVTTLETTVGNANSGLVQKVNALQAELDVLSGGAGSITTQIENALGTLDVVDAAVVGQYVSSVSETDGKITVTRAALPDYTEVYDAKGAAATALADAKTYVDDKVDGKFDAIGSADAAQAAAIAQAKLDAAAALADYYKKSETYSKTEVDNLLSTNSTGDRAYAKQYTDELFQSIKFASNSEIDALFA